MKTKTKVILLLSLMIIAVFAFPINVSAAPLDDGKTIFGESYTLKNGRILSGDLTVFGGVVEIEQGATVDGNVLVFGGSATVDGTVTGSLVVFGGTVQLEEHALIEKDIFSPSSHVSQDASAVVQGEQISSWEGPWRDSGSSIIHTPRTVLSERMRLLPVINRVGRLIGMTLLFVALGGLLLLVIPKATGIMTNALISKPWHALGYGALAGLATLILSAILAITICLAPIAALLLLVMCLATLIGWLVLGYELGKQIVTGIFKTKWHPALIAVLGNLVLYLLARLLGLVPCMGNLIVFIVMLFGLGVVVVTLFGTRAYPRSGNPEDGKQQVLFQADPNEEQDQVELGITEDETEGQD